ncbi:hypothetical protein [Domibacillus indicus]|uniref:hypothetical protein n=1 Tax=Domibacillus indicus TaxID=1437523 RepID=UPI0006180D8B|nr:hypothetical protein [Domibacillus indicus]
MRGLIHYQLLTYIRSYQYIPPLTMYILSLLINYAYTPNPILDSYSFTSLVLFFIMGWFTVTIFHAEDPGQKQITLFHAKSLSVYYAALFTVCLLAALVFSMISTVYPVMAGSFGIAVRSSHFILGFLAHFSLAVLAVSLSSLFTRELVKNKTNTWWGVLSILIGSVVVSALEKSIGWPVWLMPPLYLSLDMMSATDHIQKIPILFYGKFGWIFLYGLLCILLFSGAVKRKM